MGPWLVVIIGSLAKRVLVALGIGVVTISALALVKSQLDSAVDAAIGGMIPSVYQIMALAGFIDSIGIWLGAMTAAIALIGLSRLAMVTQ